MSRNHDALDKKRWARVRSIVLERDGHQCQQCGATESLSVDHVIALANGGEPYAEENLTTLCVTCNGRKSDRTLVRSTWRNRVWIDDIS